MVVPLGTTEARGLELRVGHFFLQLPLEKGFLPGTGSKPFQQRSPDAFLVAPPLEELLDLAPDALDFVAAIPFSSRLRRNCRTTRGSVIWERRPRQRQVSPVQSCRYDEGAMTHA